jgi:hypothetical protein
MIRKILYAALILVPLLAVALARGSRAIGGKFALAKLTNIESVTDTIDRQVRLAGKLGLIAACFLAAVLLLFFFAPSGLGTWVGLLGSIVSAHANLLLGLAAGIGLNAYLILNKVAERDAIKAQIVMKQRARRRLQKFLSVLVIGLFLNVGLTAEASAGGRAWAWVIDITDSVDPAQREAAIAAMIDSALETARRLKATSIVVVKVGDEDFLSDMDWVAVPAEPAFEDCQKAPPAFAITKSWVTFSPISLADAKREAVSACLAREERHRANVEVDERQFVERLRNVTRIVPRMDVTTRIVPALQALVGRPYVVAVTLVSDLQDRSGTPPERLKIPAGRTVTVVVTRPNPRRSSPTLHDVLSSAERWAKIPGITVISAAEYPGYVHLAEAR